ncbi:MAG: tryptophan/tyrosine permease [Desulfovibrionaceae bacterium]|nr:tryptophan/tyrosine permease [Desulfovibrionaceae bacterium]
MTKGKAKAAVLTTAFVVTGNLIGAGILALPIKTGLAGLAPSILAMVGVWALMLSTALILANQKSLTQGKNADLPTFFEEQLGHAGKWAAVIGNMVLLYGIMVAYLSGGSAILESVLGNHVPRPLLIVAFFIPVTTVALFGMTVIRRGNAVLVLAMWLAFGTLVAMGLEHMDPARLAHVDWGFLPAALPIMVTSFHFHNIIPSLCRSMDFDQRSIRRAIVLGTLIGLAMNTVWVLVAMGAIPVDGLGDRTLTYAFEHDLPATVPMAGMIGSGVFSAAALVFAFVAISTSYMTNGLALSSFLGDLVRLPGTKGRISAACLSFLPPLCVTVIDPDLFLKALDLVGGVGINLIFGILPGVVAFKQARGRARPAALVLILAFGLLLAFELGQETGLLRNPSVGHWKATISH